MSNNPADLVKRSVTLAGHRTSIRLERGFWNELERLAEERECSLAGLLAGIDAGRSTKQSLASALRLTVLEALQGAVGAGAGPHRPPADPSSKPAT